MERLVALVAGATRGAGRGISLALGERGATVYCVGRSTRERLVSERPETIEESAELVTARGGKGIAVQADLTRPSEAESAIDIVREREGRLDVLVNDVWGGDDLTEFGKPFWELDPDLGKMMMERAIFSHIVTARAAAPLMIASGGRLIVEITDGNTAWYRGNLYYDLVKSSVIRLALAYARELRNKKIAAVAVTPGFLRSEAMLERMGVTEETYREAEDVHFAASSETPLYVGRAVAALAFDADVMKKSGRVYASWDLADEYGFTDVDGSQPHWGRYFEKTFGYPLKTCDEKFYEYCFGGFVDTIFGDWP
ncbi:MAG TPA: SDR family oxidoreductase [Thermoanaerobaculia bacterium]|nr:SDR family oxidoreductase [Thermoanaerobaculia bacterium]